MQLTRLAITRPVLIWMCLAAIGVLGGMSYFRLPAELNPRVTIPTLTVIIVYPGAGPEEVERTLTKPVEDAIGTVNNVKDVYSSSQDSVSVLGVDFHVGTDLDRALAAVREKTDALRSQLPSEVRAPIIAKLDINAQPVIYMALSGDGSLRGLRRTIDEKIRPALTRINGVASVSVVGGEEREIRVLADARRMAALGVNVQDVVNSLKGAGHDVPAGDITSGQRSTGVRTVAAFRSIGDIRSAQILSPQLMAASLIPDLPIPGAPRKPIAPSPLTVGDVARVQDMAASQTVITRSSGRDSVGIVIAKASDANAIEVADQVRATMDSMAGVLPPGTETVIARDESRVVRDALHDVNVTLVLGALLAMTVVFVFLRNFRGTVIVAVALPACIVATYALMHSAGFTLNQMTLLALSLSVGILIDDSIVVLESITRHLAAGETPAEAALNGRTEIGFASMALTLTDVVVFVPIAFMGGIVGAFFRQFGLTVAFATLFSLVVSFTVTPSLAARWYARGSVQEHAVGFWALLERPIVVLEAAYRRSILWALANRAVVMVAGVSVITAISLFSAPSLGFEFMPASDQGQIAVTVEMPPDASLSATSAMAQMVERRIATVPEVAIQVSTIGEILGGFGALPQRGAQYAQVSVTLHDRAGLSDRLSHFGGVPTGMRLHTDEQVAETIRRRLADVAGPRIVVAPVRTVANVGQAIQLQLRGQDLPELERAAEQVRDRLAALPGVLDPDVSMRSGRPELHVDVDRSRAAALDVPPALAGSILRDSIEGNSDLTFIGPGGDRPIRVRLEETDRQSPNDLRGIPVGFARGRTVTLGEIAQIRRGAGPASIDRVSGARMITIGANLNADYPLGNAQQDIERAIADIPLPGIEKHFGGESEAMAENAPAFAMALGLAVILVYLVSASLFNSLISPLVIMLTLPMALAGALGALALTGETLSLVAMVGIIMLTGLMGRNAILLVDYTGTLRSRGTPRTEAVAEAGAVRLRPILMTTLATILGMLPVALRIGRAAELRAPMAVAVIGGLVVSTALTLVVIPVVYTIFDDLAVRWSRRRGANDTPAERGTP